MKRLSADPLPIKQQESHVRQNHQAPSATTSLENKPFQDATSSDTNNMKKQQRQQPKRKKPQNVGSNTKLHKPNHHTPLDQQNGQVTNEIPNDADELSMPVNIAQQITRNFTRVTTNIPNFPIRLKIQAPSEFFLRSCFTCWQKILKDTSTVFLTDKRNRCLCIVPDHQYVKYLFQDGSIKHILGQGVNVCFLSEEPVLESFVTSQFQDKLLNLDVSTGHSNKIDDSKLSGLATPDNYGLMWYGKEGAPTVNTKSHTYLHGRITMESGHDRGLKNCSRQVKKSRGEKALNDCTLQVLREINERQDLMVLVTRKFCDTVMSSIAAKLKNDAKLRFDALFSLNFGLHQYSNRPIVSRDPDASDLDVINIFCPASKKPTKSKSRKGDKNPLCYVVCRFTHSEVLQTNTHIDTEEKFFPDTPWNTAESIYEMKKQRLKFIQYYEVVANVSLIDNSVAQYKIVTMSIYIIHV